MAKFYVLARRHPKARFAVLDVEEDEPNSYSFISGEHEGSFLAVALVVMSTKSQVIGFVLPLGTGVFVVQQVERRFLEENFTVTTRKLR